jgi:transcription elongation factor GreA
MPHYMTRKTWQSLNDRLLLLKRLAQPGGELSSDLGRANAFGDISENAERDAAIERGERVGSEMQNILQRLSGSEIIDNLEINTERVMIGTKVTLRDLDSGKELVYRILGSDDAQNYENTISVGSAIARGLLGKEQGEDVEVHVPAGTRNFEILKIEHFSL